MPANSPSTRMLRHNRVPCYRIATVSKSGAGVRLLRKHLCYITGNDVGLAKSRSGEFKIEVALDRPSGQSGSETCDFRFSHFDFDRLVCNPDPDRLDSVLLRESYAILVLIDSTDRDSLDQWRQFVQQCRSMPTGPVDQNEPLMLVLITKQDTVSATPWLDAEPGLCPAEVAAQLGLLSTPLSAQSTPQTRLEKLSTGGALRTAEAWAVLGICLTDDERSVRLMESFPFPGAELVIDWLKEPLQDEWLMYTQGWSSWGPADGYSHTPQSGKGADWDLLVHPNCSHSFRLIVVAFILSLPCREFSHLFEIIARALSKFPCWVAGWGNDAHRGHKGDMIIGWLGARLEAKIVAKTGAGGVGVEQINNQGSRCVMS